MNSIIMPSQAMSAVMFMPPKAVAVSPDVRVTTAERICQSPRSESQSRHARPRKKVSLSSSPNGGLREAFSQPESANSADIKRIEINKFLQLGGDFSSRRVCGGRLAASRQCGWVVVYCQLFHRIKLFCWDKSTTNL